MQQPYALVLHRPIERRDEVFGSLDRSNERGAISEAERREVGIAQLGTRDALWILPLLVHADRAVAGIVDDDDEQVRAVLGGGGEFLPVHQEVAVTGHADDRPVLEAKGRSDGRGKAIAHRAAGWRKLRRHRPVAPVTVPPAG